MINSNSPVSLQRCENYDVEIIKNIFAEMLSELSFEKSYFAGKKVVIKPNLVMPTSPENAVTTHPAVMEAICSLMIEYGADVLIAESSGGPYTKTTLKAIYGACGMNGVSERTGAVLNFDTSSAMLSAPSGQVTKSFEVITPILNADIILNMSKLKTHSLTQLSASVKNFFGVIPGVQKVEMHARYKDYTDFAGMLVDLCGCIHEKKQVIDFSDAIMCMEGNGPTGGTKKHVGLLLASENPFNLDIICSAVMGHEGNAQMLEIAKQRGYCQPKSADITILGCPLSDVNVSVFKYPDTKVTSKFNLIPSFLASRPAVDRKKCVGCGKCASSCPASAIEIRSSVACIDKGRCIKCYCCQELCPIHAVYIKKNPIFKLIH